MGLVLSVGSELGLHEYPDDVSYTRESKGADLIKPFNKYAKRVSDVSPGNILILKDTFYPHHVAIVGCRGDNLTIIHASIHAGKVIEDVLTERLRGLIVAVFSFKGV